MNHDNDVVYMTREGMQELTEELEQLKTIRRLEVAAKLQQAIAQGDLKENADYHAAKEEQGFIEGRIRDIEDSLRRAKIIENSGPSDVVRVGSTVVVAEEGYDDEEEYSIVGPHEADPGNGRISNESPIGSALIGSRRGQVVRVQTPGGEIHLEVRTIR
jgi:transcription elongation factor GreA